MVLLEDRVRYARIQQQALHVAGTGYQVRPIPDLALKLMIARAFLNMPTPPWSQAQIGHLLYGGPASTTGAPKLTRFIKGDPIGALQASMLAQLMNYHLDLPFDMAGWEAQEAVAEVAGWIETNGGFNWGVSAMDLAGDPLVFCRQLLHGLEVADAAKVSPDAKKAIHDRLIGSLFVPMNHASWDTRLIIEDGRRRQGLQRPPTRFGGEQRSGSHPNKWFPTEVSDSKWILEYELPRRTDRRLKCWLVTVRDPSWISITGARSTDRWVWTQSWDRLVRWLPSFVVEKDDEVVAPVSEDNTALTDITGLYRVFLFAEPADDNEAIAKAMWGEDGPPPRAIPDESAYASLCEALENGELSGRVEVYAGAYLIPG